MAKLEPKFSETRVIHPFPMSARGLAGVKFRATADQDFMDDRAWTDEGFEATPEVLHSGEFTPALKLVVNKDHLQSESGVKVADLRLAIVLQDDAAWESTTLGEWPLSSAPEQYSVDAATLKNICGQRGLTFSVIVSPVSVTKSGAAHGDVIARVDFEVTNPSDGNEFPVHVVKSEQFVNRGLSGDTAWVIDWKAESGFDDLSLPEALVVLIHEDVDARLASATNSAAGRMIWQGMASEILTEIAIRYFKAGASENPSNKSLGGMVMNVMRQGSQKAPSDLIAEAKLADSAARLRSYSQAALGLKAAMSGLKLKGMFS